MGYKTGIYMGVLMSCLVFQLSTRLQAQTTKQMLMKHMMDSMRAQAMDEYATRYPMLRQASFQYDVLGQRTVKGKLQGDPLFKGKASISRIRSNFNLPLASWGKNKVTGSVNYQQFHYNMDQVKSLDPQSTYPITNQKDTKSVVGFTGTFSRTDTLLGVPVSYSASMSGLTDEFTSIKRINYLATVTVPIKRTATSSLTLGLVGIIDPSSIIPAIPVISYWRKFEGRNLDLYIDMPSRVQLRKQLGKRSWVFLGTELGGNIYFYDLNLPSLPENTIYSTVDLKTGFNLEHKLTKKIVVGMSGGFYSLFRSNLFDKKRKSNQYFFETNGGTVPYISFSASLLPFLR